MSDKYEQIVMTEKIAVIMAAWADEYKLSPAKVAAGTEIINREWYIDPVKQTAVFVLTTVTKE